MIYGLSTSLPVVIRSYVYVNFICIISMLLIKSRVYNIEINKIRKVTYSGTSRELDYY